MPASSNYLFDGKRISEFDLNLKWQFFKYKNHKRNEPGWSIASIDTNARASAISSREPFYTLATSLDSKFPSETTEADAADCVAQHNNLLMRAKLKGGALAFDGTTHDPIILCLSDYV